MQKNGPNDDIGWIIGGIIKTFGYSFIGIFNILLHPIKFILNIIILIIIGFLIWQRINNRCVVNWIDLILLISFFKLLGYTGEKGSLVKK
jgi:hypothetical protein